MTKYKLVDSMPLAYTLYLSCVHMVHNLTTPFFGKILALSQDLEAADYAKIILA